MLRFLLSKFGFGIVGRYLRKAAEGELGPFPKALYWNAAGHKTAIGVLLALACVVGVALGEPGIETFLLGGAGATLVSAGLIDRDWRKTVPEKVKASYLYAFLRHVTPDLAAAMAYFGLMAQTCTPEDAALLAKVGLTCVLATKILVAAGAVLGFLGLKAEARVATPPSPLAPAA